MSSIWDPKEAPAKKGLSRKATSDVAGKRMLILDQDKCKKGMAAYDFLKKFARSCGRECITVDDPPGSGCKILEDACMACMTRQSCLYMGDLPVCIYMLTMHDAVPSRACFTDSPVRV